MFSYSKALQYYKFQLFVKSLEINDYRQEQMNKINSKGLKHNQTTKDIDIEQMSLVRIVKTILAHVDTINQMIINPFACEQGSQIISISLDGYLRVWKSDTLHLVRQKKFKRIYLMCIASVQDGFLIGTRHGQIIKVDRHFQILSIKKVHADGVTSIIIVNNQLITCSHDGKLKFMAKQTLNVQEEIDIGKPIFQALQFENTIYLAGTPAYKVSLESKKITQMKRYDCFRSFNGDLYACSNDKGLTCINKKTNSYIPCHYLLDSQQNLLAFSDQCIGLVNHQDHLQWKCRKVEDMKSGYSITAGVSTQKGIFVSGETGNIYKVQALPFNRVTD